MSRTVIGCLALLILAGFACLSQAQSSYGRGNTMSGPVPGQWYRLQVKHSQKYLDVAWGSRDEHAPVVQAGFSTWENGGAQLWTLVPGRDGLYRLKVKHSDKYLDVQAGMSDWENGAAQLWRFIPN